MGFGQIFTTLTFLLIFAGMIVVVINTQESLATTTNAIKEEQARLQEATQQNINILSTNYDTNQYIPWTTTYTDEFTTGTLTNTTSLADDITLAEQNTTGTYTTTPYDTGFPSNYTTINYNSIEPASTNIQFQVRTGTDYITLNNSNYVGPDGTTNTYYTTTGTPLNETHDGEQWIQVRAYLNTSIPGTTPELDDLTITVQRLTGHATLQLDNTGETKLHFEDTDVYLDGVRIPRNETARVLTPETTVDTRLWNPGETLNITVFTTLGAPATVRVTNEHAADEAIIIP